MGSPSVYLLRSVFRRFASPDGSRTVGSTALRCPPCCSRKAPLERWGTQDTWKACTTRIIYHHLLYLLLPMSLLMVPSILLTLKAAPMPSGVPCTPGPAAHDGCTATAPARGATAARTSPTPWSASRYRKELWKPRSHAGSLNAGRAQILQPAFLQ